MGMVCLVWLGIVRLGRVSWRNLGWHTDRLGQALSLSLVGLILLIVTLVGMVAVIGKLGEWNAVETLTSYTVGQRLQFFWIGLSAALIEESIFRGYLQPSLIAKAGLVGGILIGAVVFSLYHIFMGPSPFNLLCKFLFGVTLGALRGEDRSLLGPVVAHFLFWQVIGSG